MRMSRAAARVEPATVPTAREADSFDDEVPGQSIMWCLLLEAAFHHSFGGFLAMCMCHRSKAALSQSCHLALFVNAVARASTDRFFTFCDVHLARECDSQATCLRRRHEQFGPCRRSTVVCSVAGTHFPGPTLQVTSCVRTRTAHSLFTYYIISKMERWGNIAHSKREQRRQATQKVWGGKQHATEEGRRKAAPLQRRRRENCTFHREETPPKGDCVHPLLGWCCVPISSSLCVVLLSSSSWVVVLPLLFPSGWCHVSLSSSPLLGGSFIVFQSSRGARRLHDAPTALALLSLLSSSARSYLDTYQQGMLRTVAEVADTEARLRLAGCYIDSIFQYSRRRFLARLWSTSVSFAAKIVDVRASGRYLLDLPSGPLLTGRVFPMLNFKNFLMLTTGLLAPPMSRTHFIRCAFLDGCRRILLFRLSSSPSSDTLRNCGHKAACT